VIAKRRLLVLQMDSPLPSILSDTVMKMAPMKTPTERAVLQAGRTKRVLFIEVEPFKLDEEQSSTWKMSKFARKK
jgi:hypothetical protein